MFTNLITATLLSTGMVLVATTDSQSASQNCCHLNLECCTQAKDCCESQLSYCEIPSACCVESPTANSPPA